MHPDFLPLPNLIATPSPTVALALGIYDLIFSKNRRDKPRGFTFG
jgi:hypothetical protein